MYWGTFTPPTRSNADFTEDASKTLHGPVENKDAEKFWNHHTEPKKA